jgi:hypothetical protein
MKKTTKSLFTHFSIFLIFSGLLVHLLQTQTIYSPLRGELFSITVGALDEMERSESVSTIEVNNGSIRMVSFFNPTNTPNQVMFWEVINGTGTATIDRCGQLFATTNGTVLVRGSSQAYPSIYNTLEITITNQLVPISLNSAGSFAILAKTGLSVSSDTIIIGDVGVSQVEATYFNGFVFADVSHTFLTANNVIGKIYTADYPGPTPTYLTTAISDMENAYTTGMGNTPYETELYGGDISGQTINAGVYKWTSFVTINSSVTLDGNESDVWIFQISGGLTQLANTSILLTGGAKQENIFWLTAMTVSLGMGSRMEGTILSLTNITMGASSSINGNLLSQTRVDLGNRAVVYH